MDTLRVSNGEPPKHKLVEQAIREPGREPSPQPTLLNVPGASHSNQSLHKILSSDHGSGYVAPKFEGKNAQMEEGRYSPPNTCEEADIRSDGSS